MNKPQKRIVKNLQLLTLFIVILTLISISESSNKVMLNIFIGGSFLLYLINNKGFSQQTGYGVNSVSFNEFIEGNKYIKLWLIIYCLLFLPYIIFTLYNGSEYTGWLYATAFILLFGPVFITSEVQRYIHAGKNA